MNISTPEEAYIQTQVVKCLAHVVLNMELFYDGQCSKLLVDMDEDDYEEYSNFIKSL